MITKARSLQGKRGGFKSKVSARHNDMADRCDREDKRTPLDMALDRLFWAVENSPLRNGDPLKALAIITYNKGKDRILDEFKRDENNAIHHVDSTCERLKRQGNAPTIIDRTPREKVSAYHAAFIMLQKRFSDALYEGKRGNCIKEAGSAIHLGAKAFEDMFPDRLAATKATCKLIKNLR